MEDQEHTWGLGGGGYSVKRGSQSGLRVKLRVRKTVKLIKEPATWTSGRRAMQAEALRQKKRKSKEANKAAAKLQECVVAGGGQRMGTPGQGLSMEGSVSHYNDSVGDGDPGQVGAKKRQHLTFDSKSIPLKATGLSPDYKCVSGGWEGESGREAGRPIRVLLKLPRQREGRWLN